MESSFAHCPEIARLEAGTLDVIKKQSCCVAVYEQRRAGGCVEVQRLTRLILAARSGGVMLKQNLAAVSTATLVRKVSPVFPPYTASDLWEGVRDGTLVESEIIWW